MSDTPESEKAEPLFRLDLGVNGGGELAPYSSQELLDWFQREIQFWSWFTSAPGHSYRSAFDVIYSDLQNGFAAASRFHSHADPNSLADVQNHLRRVYVNSRLPHSSTALARLVESMRLSSPERGMAFLFPHLENSQGARFESGTAAGWHAYILGLLHVFGGPDSLNEVGAQRAALEQVNADALALLAQRRTDYDRLYTDLTLAIAQSREQDAARANVFESFMQEAKRVHEENVQVHKTQMEGIRNSYLEAMALRAPVDYWTKRGEHHKTRSRVLTGVVLFAFAALIAGLYWAAAWAIGTSPDPAKPDPWRLVMVGATGVLGIWLLRIIVRMFLSDLHLATDAAERVTMVQTYLALVEGDKLAKDDDRKLVLQPLFRPGADGMVKEDALPHPVLDYFTKAGGR